MKYRCVRLVVCALALCTAGFADVTLDWVSSGSNVWQGFYVGPYIASYTVDGNTTDLNLFCIDYNHEIAPPMEWQANIVPFSVSNVKQYQYGGIYPNLTTSNASASYLQLVWLATQMETALTAGLPTDEMDAILDVYQVADWLVFVDPNHEADLQNRIDTTGGAYSFNTALGLWDSSSTGSSFQFAVNSALDSAEAAVANGFGSNPGDLLGWSVVTTDPTWDAQNQNGVPLQEFLTYTPPSDGLSPVPEPSQVVLMVTMLALAALVAKRATKRHIVANR